LHKLQLFTVDMQTRRSSIKDGGLKRYQCNLTGKRVYFHLILFLTPALVRGHEKIRRR
jgi:hypothetical protein